ncbi:MAG: TolB family protein [Gemmatimonadota bacterium]
MRRHHPAPLAATALAAFAAVACDSAIGPAGGSGLTIRGDPALEDTIAAPPARVVVHVPAIASLSAPMQVTFRYGPMVTPGLSLCCVYYLQSVGPGPVIDTTDGSREAEATLLHGTAAEGQFLVVEARALGPGARLIAVDSVVVRTTPGQPARILIAPRDTALFQGDSVAFAVTAADRYGNRRAEVVQLSAGTAGVSVSGNVVRADAGPSRQLVRAQATGVKDSTWVSIVPRGELLAHAMRAIVGDSIGVAIVRLDGSGFRRVVVETQPRQYTGEEPPGHEMNPRWDPTAARLVYQEMSATQRLFVADLAGHTQPLIFPSPFSAEFHPDFSPDGVWVYFAARSPGLAQSTIWRVHADGTSLEQAPFGPDGSESRPAVSPDGQWLAYTSDGFVHVRSLVTGDRTALHVSGTAPRWSPAGDFIAYVVTAADYSGYSGPLRIVRPDGTDDRQLVTAEAYAPGVDWTPDGQYIVAKTANFGLLELIAVASGATIPLPYSARLSSPAWRP